MTDDPIVAAARDVATAGRAAFADIDVNVEDIAGHIRSALGGDLPDEVAVHGPDLYLAVACARGDDSALRILSEQFVPDMVRAMQKRGLDSDDVRQEVMERLLVGEQRRISQYAGLGRLRSWLISIGVRTALNARRRTHREVALEPKHLFDAMEAAVSPELGGLRVRFRGEAKRAFQDAFFQLTSRQRNILRYQYLHGMNIDGMGAVFGVHRATVARWREATRVALLDGTRENLQARHDLSASEVDSLLRLVASGLDVSLSRILRANTER